MHNPPLCQPGHPVWLSVGDFCYPHQTFAISEGLIPPTPAMTRILGRLNLERGLFAAMVVLGGGLVLLLAAIDTWRLHHYGALDYAYTMRLVIPGATLTALGFQTMLSSFFS